MSKKEKTPVMHIQRTAGDWVFDITIIVLFVLFTLICIFPFYYLLINTISDNDLVTSGKINFFPMLKNAAGDGVFGVQINNYAALRNVQDLGSSVMVTVARTILGTALMVITSAWAGYLVTKQKMWKRSFWYRFLVVTMYFNAGLVPWYMNMLMMGLTDNFLAYIIPGMVAPYNIILVKTYIESIPASLEESAVIDGAFHADGVAEDHPAAERSDSGDHRHLRRGGQLELLPGFPAADEQPPGSVYPAAPAVHLPELLLQPGRHDEPGRNGQRAGRGQHAEPAGDSVHGFHGQSIIPILLVYPFMQRYFVKGIMLGAVKG